MDIIPRLKALREAGHVTRCHTFDHLKHYDVAMHCWHAVTLLLILRPESSLACVKHLLWHDNAERWTGDFPATLKWLRPELGVALGQLESEIRTALGCSPSVTPEEALWCDWMDKLELWLWTWEEVCRGNLNAMAVRRNLEEHYFPKQDGMPEVIWHVLRHYTWSRNNDTIPQ